MDPAAGFLTSLCHLSISAGPKHLIQYLQLKMGLREIIVNDYRNATSLLSRMSEQILQEGSVKATYKWKVNCGCLGGPSCFSNYLFCFSKMIQLL